MISVIALSQGGDLEVLINDRDVRTDTYRDSGPGGQHRNTTDSAVRLTHLPTGISVTATEERSQYLNRVTAWQRLRSVLTEQAAAEQSAERNSVRQATLDEFRSFTWTGWRDKVVGPDGRTTSMQRALAGRLDPLLN